MSDNTFDEQFKNETVSNLSVESEKTETEKVTKKKKEEVAFTLLDKPSRILPSIIEEILEKNIPVRLTKKGYLVGGFYGLGDSENKGFATAQETTKDNTLVFFDNKGREHVIQSFEDLVKFHNFIWGVFFKVSEDYKKPDIMWFQYMLQYGVVSITPGNVK